MFQIAVTHRVMTPRLTGICVSVSVLKQRHKAIQMFTATQFAIILTIMGDVVTRFQMLEDSFGVSKAART